MRKLNFKIIILSLITVALLGFFTIFSLNFFGMTFFGAKQSMDENTMDSAGRPELPTQDSPSKGEESFNNVGGTDGEKIITNFYLNYETITFENDMTALREMLQTYEGYIESSDIYQQGSYDGKNYKYGSLTIRIPKNKANAFIEETKKKFHLVRENSSAQNVTLSYKDTELRLQTLEKQKDRLNELYAKAERIEDIISIESKLSDVILQIESLKAELSYLDRAVDYTTVTVSLNEVANLTNSPDIRASFTERITVAFKDSLRFFKEASTEFAVFLVYTFPFLIILIVVLSLGLLFRKKGKSKKTVTMTKHSDDPPVK